MPTIELNKYGFHEVKEKPSEAELEIYYSQKYYQDTKGTYEKAYAAQEQQYIYNKIAQKQLVLEKHFNLTSLLPLSLLDVGSGEGWVLSYYKQRNWQVTGLDFSRYGCETFNPGCLENLLTGNIYENIQKLIAQKEKFTVIWLDNVLEHVVNPHQLLLNCRELVADNGALVVEVPNDFSPLQQYLKETGAIDSDFWVALPDHLSYFNKAGLLNIAADSGWDEVFTMADFPIDFALVNPDTNYVKDRSKGKECNQARIQIDNLMHTISIDKTVEYYRALADLGMGRQIISFFKPHNHAGN
ncbi:class I SAM-dependent methyltransferase [Adhaeribacter radiodurans]|uniref:Class I SAM-dependent methyltransferase n=1 Tax=Adhaeribacter radiodurans TaxID=2745197 RepID=A0A7L7L9B7_9BACT|nr:class I SAM-dependent methyltransferase [Adhaeribacter radiodurans]QMU28979.1 class I SAM-dependent methyltransferase [Adhaeribacter radiodurans]